MNVPLAIPPPPCRRVRSLPHHHPIPVFAARNAKNPQSESRFAGFVSGPICPVDFIFMPQQKEQIKNFLPENRKKFPEKAQHGKKGIFFNTLGKTTLLRRIDFQNAATDLVFFDLALVIG
jgi:hypothetical protein